MSSDHGPGAPSFGDLFEDPDSPLPASPPPAGSPTAPGPDVAEPVRTPAPVQEEEQVREEEPVEPAQPVMPAHPVDDSAERSARDLDHESAEAAHLVAGFEHVADEPVVVAPATAAAGAAAAARWDGTVDPSVSSAPAPRVDTGRLYRSAGAEGPATLDAIPAIDPARAPGRRVEAAEERPARASSPDRGLTYSGVVVIVMGVTVLVAVAEALLRKEIGWLTGVALLASSVYCAVVVRRADIWAAVVIPPLAFLVALLTAGQLTILGKSGGLLVREGALLFVSLATNAPWILGTTLVCLVIVIVRRRRAATTSPPA